MYKKSLILTLIIAFVLSCQKKNSDNVSKIEKPNIIILYANDLGYGDVSCYGATQVNTPNIDQLAAEGLKFTDAHSAAASSTPSRYALLTGKYAFRKKAHGHSLSGTDPLLIDLTNETMPLMFHNAGYATAVIGMWNLGLGDGEVNWNERISPGPLEVGFDYSYIIPATGDRVPCVLLENQEVVNLNPKDPITVSYTSPIGDEPKAYEHPELLRYPSDRYHSDAIVNGVGRIGYMSGGKAALWREENFAKIFTEKAKGFIGKSKGEPFFLYLAFHGIHGPRLPHDDFKGKTKMGPRGDAIVEIDWCVGEIVSYIKALGLAKNSLIVFTSDNGPVLNDGYEDQSVALLGNHKPSGPFRGGKYSAYEAGTRVPTIVYWPEIVELGTSDALVSQIDLYSSFAELLKVPRNEELDGENMLSTFLGKTKIGKECLIEESLIVSLRKNNWKYIPATEITAEDWLPQKGIEGGFQSSPQLFDLNEDISESNNLAWKYPKMVIEFDQILKKITKG